MALAGVRATLHEILDGRRTLLPSEVIPQLQIHQLAEPCAP